MATRLYGILTDGLNKPIVNATVALLAKGNTITVLNGSEAVFRTDGEGAYNVTVQAGHYKVIIGPQGLEPYKAGEIVIYSDSPEGSLNGYLINWAPEELTPDVIKQVQQLVANSEEYALQAGRSAAAANADATDARNSKSSAAQSASDALVYKNDAKASEDAARQAQAGAAGSANTATQAVTTVQNLKKDVERLKTDTQTIKDGAVGDINTAKTSALEEMNVVKTETVEAKDQARDYAQTAANARDKAQQYATTSTEQATASSNSANRSETAAQQAESTLASSLKKDQNLSDLQSKSIARSNLEVPSNTEAFLKKDNLEGIVDRAAAWLNVRPLGATPLAADPVEELDAVTRRWALTMMADVSVNNTFQALYDVAALPSGVSAGGWVTSRLSENGVPQADSSMSVALTKGDSVAVTRIAAVSRVGGFKQAILALDSNGNTSTEGETRGKVFSGRDGAYGPAVIKKADRSSADIDNVNYLAQVANNTSTIYQYLVSPSGAEQQFVTRLDVTGEPIKYFSIRVDNGMYTPEGRVAIQGSDIRIKDQFKPPKEGAWNRVEQIGIMEFYYKGNKTPQRSYLAQQMEAIDPLYVFRGGKAIDEEGKEFEILNVNDKAVMADLITVVQQLQQKVTQLESQLQALQPTPPETDLP